MIRDRDISESEWNKYLDKYTTMYVIHIDEIGISCIKLNKNMGYIQPYSIVNKKLIAVMDFKHNKTKNIIKRKLERMNIQIVQDGDCELSFVFPESILKSMESIINIRKRRDLSEKTREKYRQTIKNVIHPTLNSGLIL